MNRFVTAIGIVTTLAITQSCTPLFNAKKEALMTTTTQHHSDQVMAETNHSHHIHANRHVDAPTLTQTKLTTFSTISPNTPVFLQIEVQDNHGNAISQFESFQEQVMHLIAVSDDLQVFQHLHPIYKGNGRFDITAQFPQSGAYTLFSDYKPVGQPEQVSILKTTVDGTSPSAAHIDWNRTRTFGQTIVDFAPTQATVKAGEEVTLRFNLQDATTRQPVTNLQPYLGEKGHLVILRQSPALSRADYVHAHAVPNTPASQVHFATRFPQVGKYKLWGQFNRGGEIVTADYWVDVIP
ncbi:hypothetical protein [Leptolyngbya sp. FACHB-17]|uniref:hypothetical protein n=1 Tax=unclassified Leptolyngbya TaxID=2650499 RepID=UPI0016817EEA|nr:hypothetical protein [Leptolyngbya sp. FACHB-17]MBD2078487.1 hypothetical protein [Leptolyngbya sp. FACHB-17]